MQATAISPSNIAFVKYWGKKEQVLRLPENASFSMTLDDIISTKTTVEFDANLENDIVFINDIQVDGKKSSKVSKHLDRVRQMAGINFKAKVDSSNTFPSGTGISSSASGFAALSMAASKAAGLDLSEKELSILARQGSGSACRSIPGGFVEWMDGETSENSYSITRFSPNHWDLMDIVAVVSEGVKDVSSSEGQEMANSSPFYQTRLMSMAKKIELVKELVAKKDFTQLGETIIEPEALELHAIMLTSRPSLIYWTEGTLKLMKLVKKWRKEGLELYFTVNTGQDTHLICQQKDEQKVIAKLKELDFVKKILPSKVGFGSRIINN
jgi:diphosphomevalonate decarboxylase